MHIRQNPLTKTVKLHYSGCDQNITVIAKTNFHIKPFCKF